jgi:hypothetical protein
MTAAIPLLHHQVLRSSVGTQTLAVTWRAVLRPLRELLGEILNQSLPKKPRMRASQWRVVANRDPGLPSSVLTSAKPN